MLLREKESSQPAKMLKISFCGIGNQNALLCRQKYTLLFLQFSNVGFIFANILKEIFHKNNLRFFRLAKVYVQVLNLLTAMPLFKKSLFHQCKFHIWNAITGDLLIQSLVYHFVSNSIVFLKQKTFCIKFYRLSKTPRTFFMILPVEASILPLRPLQSANVWNIIHCHLKGLKSSWSKKL